MRIDRHKLERLIAHEDVKLSVSELNALDAFLAPFGEGLAEKPLFEPAGIVAEIARDSELTFLLTSDPAQGMRPTDISTWDFRSTIEVMRAVQGLGRLQVDLEEVEFRKGMKPSAGSYKREAWYQRLAGQSGALVSIGSPRVAWSSEITLSEMFAIAPFSPPGGDGPALPFRFFWPEQHVYFPSSFVSARPACAEDTGDGEGMMGLFLGKQLLTAPHRGPTRIDYGIIAAQRRRTGHIRLVIAGLTGAATLAAAQALTSLTERIPDGKDGADSPVLWAAIEADVQSDQEQDGRRRLGDDPRVVRGPEVWPPA